MAPWGQNIPMKAVSVLSLDLDRCLEASCCLRMPCPAVQERSFLHLLRVRIMQAPSEAAEVSTGTSYLSQLVQQET